MSNLKKIKLDVILILLVIFLISIYHISSYFNSPWEIYGESINQLKHNNIIIKATPFFAFFAFVILIVMFLLKRKYPAKMIIPIGILFVFGIIWMFYCVVFDNISITLLIRDNFPPIVMFLPCLLFVGYDDQKWPLIKKIIIYLSIFFTFYSFIEVFIAYYKFGFNYRITYGAPMYCFIIGLYATYGYIILTDDWKKNRKLFTFILVVLLFFNSAILQGRSWFIQTIFLFLIYLHKIRSVYKNNKILSIVIPLSVILFVALIFFVNSDLFSALFKRFKISGDTRTTQLKMFFEQVDIGNLVIGQGMNASYLFNDNPNYKFIDNQMLLFMFRYGIIPTILYFYLLIYPIVKSLIIKNKKIFGKCLVLISWIAASVGVSVYFNYSFSLSHILVLIYAGRIFYEISFYNTNKKMN